MSSAPTNSTVIISPAAEWEDQGLFVSLGLNIIVLTIAVIAYDVLQRRRSPIFIRRLLRPGRPEASGSALVESGLAPLLRLNEYDIAHTIGPWPAAVLTVWKAAAYALWIGSIPAVMMMVLFATDTRLNRGALKPTDPYECAQSFGDYFGCDGKPWCTWVHTNSSDVTNSTAVCVARPRHGLFDLTSQNLSSKIQWRGAIYGIAVLAFALGFTYVVRRATAQLRVLVTAAHQHRVCDRYQPPDTSALKSAGARTVMISGPSFVGGVTADTSHTDALGFVGAHVSRLLFRTTMSDGVAVFSPSAAKDEMFAGGAAVASPAANSEASAAIDTHGAPRPPHGFESASSGENLAAVNGSGGSPSSPPQPSSPTSAAMAQLTEQHLGPLLQHIVPGGVTTPHAFSFILSGLIEEERLLTVELRQIQRVLATMTSTAATSAAAADVTVTVAEADHHGGDEAAAEDTTTAAAPAATNQPLLDTTVAPADRKTHKALTKRAAKLETKLAKLHTKIVPLIRARDTGHRSAVDVIRGHAQQRCIGAVFITFDSAIHATEFVTAFESLQRTKPSIARQLRDKALLAIKCQIAGPAWDIRWDSIAASTGMSLVRRLAMYALFTVLVFFWGTPVAFVGSIDNLASLPLIGQPFGRFVRTLSPNARGLLSAYLPTIALSLFNILLPYVIHAFSIVGGPRTHSIRKIWALRLYFLFTFLSGVVLQAVLQGGVSQLPEVIDGLNFESIAAMILSVVSPWGGYWSTYILSASGVGVLLHLMPPSIFFFGYVEGGGPTGARVAHERDVARRHTRSTSGSSPKPSGSPVSAAGAADTSYGATAPAASSSAAAAPAESLTAGEKKRHAEDDAAEYLDGTGESAFDPRPVDWPVITATLLFPCTIALSLHATTPLLVLLAAYQLSASYLALRSVIIDAGPRARRVTTNFRFPLVALRILLWLHTFGVVGALTVAGFKRLWSAMPFCVLAAFLSIYCHRIVGATLVPLVKRMPLEVVRSLAAAQYVDDDAAAAGADEGHRAAGASGGDLTGEGKYIPEAEVYTL